MSAIVYADSLDLSLNELQNFKVQALAADPAVTEARLYYNTVSHTLRYHNGTAWTDLAAASYTDEQAQDAVAAAFAAGSNTVVTVTYNDAGNSITLGIGASQITLAMLANIAAHTYLGNNTAGAAAPIALTRTQLLSDLALTHTDVSDFDTAVRASTLNQMTAPTADLSINSHKLTSVTDGVAASDAATVGQVQALVNTGYNKTSVRVASTANIAVASALVNASTIDGVAVATGDRVLLKNQTAQAENGIWVVVASGAASRATDADIAAEVKGGLSVWVNEGTVNGDTRWVLTTNDPITLGTTALTFTQDFAATATTAGTGLSVTGGVINANAGATPASAAGPGGGLKANADDLVIDHTIVPLMFKGATAGGATSEVITHNLGTRDVQVQCWSNTTPWQKIEYTVEATSTNTITLRSGANIAAGVRVVVMG